MVNAPTRSLTNRPTGLALRERLAVGAHALLELRHADEDGEAQDADAVADRRSPSARGLVAAIQMRRMRLLERLRDHGARRDADELAVELEGMLPSTCAG